MALRTRRTRVAAIVAALLLIGACSSGDDDAAVDSGEQDGITADDGVADSDSDADADDADGASDTGDDPDAGTETGDGDGEGNAPAPTDPPASDGSSTQQTPAPTTSSSTPAPTQQKPDSPHVPKSGTYTFERTTTSDEGTETDTSDAEVERLSGDDTAGRVRLTLEGEQGTLTNDVTMSADGSTLVESSMIDSPLGEINCDWNPDWLLVGALSEASSWTFDSVCSDDKGTLEVEVSISGNAKVVGIEEITIAGETVVAWIIESTTVTDFTVKSPTLNGTGHSESVSRSWVDPGRGMQVRDHSTNTSSGDFGSGTSETTLEFLSFTAA